MTATEFKAKQQEMSFKVKGVATKTTADGKDAYEVELFAPFRGRDGVERISDYPTRLFIRSGELVSAKEMYEWLAKQSNNTVRLVVEPGRLKQGKENDGVFTSYFWNVVGMPTSELGQATLLVQPDEEALFEDEPPPTGTLHARPKDYWDAKDALIGMSWAIDQARQTVMAYHGGDKTGGWRPEFWNTIKKEIADLAPRFLAMRDYLLGKKE